MTDETSPTPTLASELPAPPATPAPVAPQEPVLAAEAPAEPTAIVEATPTDAAPVPAAPVAAAPIEAERIGRFSRAELEAMKGKRGRKPAEFHALFPEGTAATAKVSATAKASSPTPRRRAAPLPKVSSAIIGDHSIDELLGKAGTTGSKPAAYHILIAAAEHLLAAGAVEAPITDDLARRVSEAPAKVRRMVEALLDASA